MITEDTIDSHGSALDSALGEWTRLLGSAGVVRDASLLRRASTATLPTRPRVLAILKPGSRQDVQHCLRIANRFGVPVYPSSSGKNWGYGSRVPVQDAVLLDLARLNRILDFDAALAYVTIEPGVTQQQLFEFLRERNSGLWMDATGSSPDCSIIGNALERGFGHTTMADHCSHVCGFEVILPTGECLETGFGRFPGATTGPLNKWGLGPSLDGLFSQSNLGIITRMTVWLMPAPAYFQAFFFMTRDEQGLHRIVEALRPLRLNGTIRSTVHIGNDYKVLSATSQYPWGETGGKTPLDAATMEHLRARLSVGRWNGSGGLYGTRLQVRAARRELRRALAGKVDRLQFVDDRLFRLISRFARPYRFLTGWDLNRLIKVMSPIYNLMKGVPTDASLPSAYWRKKMPVPIRMDPDGDGCGLIWCSPVLPSTGVHADAVTRLASTVLLEHGFEPLISMSLATERSLICIIAISYDRDVPGEDGRALQCYRALTDQLLASGYPPYRLNVSSMDYMDREDEYARVVQLLKAMLDPRRVLAPGRYEPGAARSASDYALIGDAGVGQGR